MMILAFRVITILFVIFYGAFLFRDVIKNGPKNESMLNGIMGFVLNILDTLGVGSNATQAAFFKFTKLSPDDELPGNGNVIFAIPVAVEFLLFLDIVEVEPITLITMIAASVLGAVVGAKIVCKLPINAIRGVLAVTLPFVAVVLVVKINGIGPFGIMGDATGLTGAKLIIGILVNFVLGALMTCGVGLYAPCMALCALLGMNLTVAFPIMMGSCAFLMPPASVEFIKNGRYNRGAAMIATITGVIGVFVAYYIVKSMPITALTYIVALVLIYMSASFIITLMKEKKNA